ncbi:MAG: ribosome small subunit-dependent GTPase A [Anaerolineae bacterium]|nr:ribosome small subunit-dependent GTPase A [Anaerolineae bacterium]
MLLKQPDQTGLVVKTHSGFYTVQTDSHLIICQLRGTLKQANKKTELCVIGDRVTVEAAADSTSTLRGTITSILPRERVLSRVEPSAYAGTSTEREQVLIANLDQAVFVFAAAKPSPNPRTLDRFLVAAEKAEISSIVIVINKADIATDETRELIAIYEQVGYPVLHVSAAQGIGIEALREQLSGQISIFTGPSGVGKSSLLNAIQPGLGQAIGAVSEKLTKGKHTTVNAELIPLQAGGYVADTPGIRTLAPWDVEPHELDGYFREFRPYVSECGFSDCTHLNEPGCAVIAAVERGEISPIRYDSYSRLRVQLEEEYVY